VTAAGPSPEAPQELAFDYDRTVALSDGVFAIALTLLVLNITVPELTSRHHGEIGDRLLDRWPEVRSYIISFAVISYLWFRHHGFFRGLDRIDGRITLLNLVYLGLVAFLPYPTRVLGLYDDQGAAIVLYAGTAATVSLVAGLMRAHATRAGLLSEAGRRHLARREPWGIAPAIFLISIPIGFVSTAAAELTWLLLLSLPAMRTLRR
jgi:TMEM175 potassium channel family protein